MWWILFQNAEKFWHIQCAYYFKEVEWKISFKCMNNVTKRMNTHVTFSALSSGRKRPLVKHLNVTCSDKNSRHYGPQWLLVFQWLNKTNLPISSLNSDGIHEIQEKCSQWDLQCKQNPNTSRLYLHVLQVILTCCIFSGLWAFFTLALQASRSNLLASRVLFSFYKHNKKIGNLNFQWARKQARGWLYKN